MTNKNKIIIMSKLAIYEKNYGKQDKKIIMYYKNDYIYLNNFKTRIFCSFACLILIGLYISHKILFDNIDIYNFDIFKTVKNSILFIIIMLIIYTIIETIQSTKKYNKAKKRHTTYINGLTLLNKEEQDYYKNTRLPQGGHPNDSNK